MGNGGDERKVAKEVKTSKTRRFARTKRTKRARFRPSDERRGNARANDSTKETDGRTNEKDGRGVYFLKQIGRSDTVRPLVFVSFSRRVTTRRFFIGGIYQKKRRKMIIEMFEKVSEMWFLGFRRRLFVHVVCMYK